MGANAPKTRVQLESLLMKIALLLTFLVVVTFGLQAQSVAYNREPLVIKFDIL